MRKVIGWGGALLLCCASMVGVACAATPEETLRNVTSDLTAQVEKNKAEIQKDPNKINTLVETIVIPHMDFDYMSRWVLGRPVWNAATLDQRKRFEAAFEQLLIHTYASVVIGYANESITYIPPRSGADSDQNRVQVESTVSQSGGGQPIHIVYRLIRRDGEADWRVYDMVIEGVSLMKGFQSQFETELKDAGLDGLIQHLQDHYTVAPVLQPKMKASHNDHA